MSAARPWSEGDLGHLRNVECTTTYDTLVCDRAANHIRDLETQLARVRELPGKWRKEELPAAAKERRYPWKRGLLKCSGELEAALDNPKPEG